VIDLCLSMYNWATFRQTKGAVKLHLLLDHDGYLPVYAHLTEGRVHEMVVAKSLNFAKGTVVVMDRGYIDYKLFARWTKAGIFFVTRLKENANYWDFEDWPLPKSGNVLKDQLIRLNPITSGAPCREDLRLVTVWDERNQCEVRLLTNQLQFAANTIAAIYRERWQIELFFKALKQNLRIKTFVGTSANAVRIQIWTALIAILLLKILQFKSTFGWALSNLVALLRWNLFSYRDLWEWINRPFDTPPESPAIQGELFDLDSILGSQT
jgi:IS4 transposase